MNNLENKEIIKRSGENMVFFDVYSINRTESIDRVSIMPDCLELVYSDVEAFEEMKDWMRSYEVDFDTEEEVLGREKLFIIKHYWR